MTPEKERLKILITGCYAPPFGGASVYVKRLFDYLVGIGHTCHVYDVLKESEEPGPPGVFKMETKVGMYTRILFSKKYDILHINESMWKHRAALVLLARIRGTKSVITLHSFRDAAEDLSLLNRLALRYTLKNADYIISPGKNEMDRVLEMFPKRKGVNVVTPFIPPDMSVSNWVLPMELRGFISQHQTVLCANGSNMDFYKGGDIYGLDMMVELCRTLRPAVDAGVIYCLTYVNDPQYLDQIKRRIDEYGLQEHFLIYTEEIEFWKVIAKTTAFIRPTRTDSFGISVAEGVFLKKHTIASDVCERPPGTILFRTGDMDDLVDKTLKTLRKQDVEEDQEAVGPQLNGAPMIESIYYQLVTDQDGANGA